MATTLRAWDAPSRRLAAATDSNRVLTGMLAKFGQDTMNRRLKRQVKQANFQVQMWASRTTARAGAVESASRAANAQAAGLQQQASNAEAMAAQVRIWAQDEQRRIDARKAWWERQVAQETDPIQRKALADRANAELQKSWDKFEREQKRRTRAANQASRAYRRDAAAYEANARSSIQSATKRYEQGQNRYERAVKRQERAVRRYENNYYPVR